MTPPLGPIIAEDQRRGRFLFRMAGRGRLSCGSALRLHARQAGSGEGGSLRRRTDTIFSCASTSPKTPPASKDWRFSPMSRIPTARRSGRLPCRSNSVAWRRIRSRACRRSGDAAFKDVMEISFPSAGGLCPRAACPSGRMAFRSKPSRRRTICRLPRPLVGTPEMYRWRSCRRHFYTAKPSRRLSAFISTALLTLYADSRFSARSSLAAEAGAATALVVRISRFVTSRP